MFSLQILTLDNYVEKWVIQDTYFDLDFAIAAYQRIPHYSKNHYRIINLETEEVVKSHIM